MKKSLQILLVLSLILNLSIVYVGYKALEYREHINEFLEKYTYVIDEFSGWNDYHEANKQYIADSTVNGRVVFIGTQLTYNWDLASSFPGYEALNRGIVGQRYSGYLLRFRSDVIELAPEAVVIEFSSYNFRPESKIEEFIEYTESLAELALANNITPILTTVLPVGADFDVEMEIEYAVNDSVMVYNQWLREYCSDNKIQYIDFHRLMADDHGEFNPDYLFNQIQPNNNGYKILTDNTLQVFNKLVIQPRDISQDTL